MNCDESTEDSQDESMELEIRGLCLYPPGYLTQSLQQEGSIHLHGIQEKQNSPRHRVSKLNVHPTYKKGRKDGILVEFSFSLRRPADLPYNLTLASNSCQLSPNQFTAVAKLASNALSTSSKQSFAPKTSHRWNSQRNNILKRTSLVEGRGMIYQLLGITSSKDLRPNTILARGIACGSHKPHSTIRLSTRCT